MFVVGISIPLVFGMNMKYSVMNYGWKMKRVSVTLILITGLFFWINAESGTTTPPDETARAGDIAAQYVKTELYYGAGLREGRGDYETLWNDYLDNDVTPRFREGLTLLEATGQWRVKEGNKPRRNRSKILILIHEASPKKFDMIEEVREIWKEKSGHRSVLKVTIPAEVSY